MKTCKSWFNSRKYKSWNYTSLKTNYNFLAISCFSDVCDGWKRPFFLHVSVEASLISDEGLPFRMQIENNYKMINHFQYLVRLKIGIVVGPISSFLCYKTKSQVPVQEGLPQLDPREIIWSNIHYFSKFQIFQTFDDINQMYFWVGSPMCVILWNPNNLFFIAFLRNNFRNFGGGVVLWDQSFRKISPTFIRFSDFFEKFNVFRFKIVSSS